MYALSFSRGQVALGAASAMIMLSIVAAILVPYLYSESRSQEVTAMSPRALPGIGSSSGRC